MTAKIKKQQILRNRPREKGKRGIKLIIPLRNLYKRLKFSPRNCILNDVCLVIELPVKSKV